LHNYVLCEFADALAVCVEYIEINAQHAIITASDTK
jgi:hypothetical protein